MRQFVPLRAACAAAVWLSVTVLCPNAAVAACVFAGTAATCTGDESAGISLPDSSGVTSLDIHALTTTVAPPAPTTGVLLETRASDAATAGGTGAPGSALTVTADGTVVVQTHGDANVPAPAILVLGTGGNGGAGSPAPDGDSNGTGGGAGGQGSAIAVTSKGSLASSNLRTVNTRAVEFGLQSVLADASSNLANATTEQDIRAFLQSTTDPTIQGICGGNPCTAAQAVNSLIRLEIVTANVPAYTSQFGTGTSFPFIGDDAAKLSVEIRTDSVTAAFLSNPPLPGEMRGRTGVSGVVSGTSIGGNGANGGEGGANSSANPIPLGGNGGNGGAGGPVTVTNFGAIASAGDFNSGILALGLGGNAGSGGGNSIPGLGLGGVGGIGGTGGQGGAVTVTNSGTITTSGTDSVGIYAQSVGGTGAPGGGHGAGDGSDGGSGGAVSVTESGKITTRSYGAYGVFAQSAGGTGGDANNNNGGAGGSAGDVAVTVSGAISTAGNFAAGVFASSQGGQGGAGAGGNGNGGDGGVAGSTAITVATSATIETAGDNAAAVYAQSRGGSGGIGASSTNLFWASAGGGGNGGLGGNVNITSRGTVRTSGDFAYGLFAQALGGTGGFGGTAAALVAQSGSGGGGAAAGAATVDNLGVVTTLGTGSSAIFAQSVAGGGGNAGSAGGLVALGGNGGSEAEALCRSDPSKCNNGGAVTVTNSGRVTASGDFGNGIFAESVGGGGGDGGGSTGLITIGGDGGAGGNGGLVTVHNSAAGAVSVSGQAAYAIFAQSVGGGGGNGGDATSLGLSTTVAIGGSGGTGGIGSAVAVTNDGSLSASGNRSAGIFAQSVGGGGGNGGNASAEGLSALTIAVGGKGGDGGSGGTVSVTNNGSINVGGDNSNGVFAQSVGGGGGNGGSASTFGVAPVVQISVAVGGDGGGAGNGDAVGVVNNGSIVTTGIGSVGVFAQSVGGGGGNGGDASATSISAGVSGAPVTVSVAVAVGGKAGDGGDGGTVAVNNKTGATITTFGRDAHAIQAQSVGGGGGDGGSASASAKVINGTKGVAVSIAVGGSGGDGGAGGTVSVINDSAVVTNGAGAIGIFAQSIGGGGGNGGDANADASVDAEKLSAGVSVAVGGKAGGGGDGAGVTVTNNGSILTADTSAYGIFAQSVGGGGGTGGAASSSMEAKLSPAVSVGGSGGDGGLGGNVTVTNDGSIATSGDKAVAVFVQSVGGGGGTGGDASGEAKAADNPDKKSYDIAVSVGGSGGSGGDGGAVSVVNNGSIATSGVNAYGVFAQSVGGGGGVGGAATASGDDGSYSLAVSVGGSGGDGGTGGLVTATNIGAIRTLGSLSYGLFAQSVGGGGGAGGAASSQASSGNDNTEKGSLALGVGGDGGTAGSGGTVTLTNSGAINTSGYGAHGIFAQSVGGGGGVGAAGKGESKGKVNVGAGIGGKGGASGDGGAVQVSNAGTIITRADDAYGILAQSVGGGGGAAGDGSGNGAGLKSIGVSVGGNAGAAGSGDSVTVVQSGDIATLGTQSFGIFAQSVGGGGGIGGAGENNTGGQISVGGKGGAAGNGGHVAVNLTGNISTTGDGAHGIFAQSIGGGGGLGGDVNTQTEDIDLKVATISHKAIVVGVGATGAGGGGGNGGAVDIISAGTIVTTGQNAYGILAQSVGGGGGLSGQNDGSTLAVKIGSSTGGFGTGGAISINHTGSIYALGADSHGIFAQSTGPSGGGNIAINLAGGAVVGGGKSDAIGSTGGAGVYIDGGANNTLTLASGASASALSGTAIIATGGNDRIDNSGLVAGNVALGAGANAFNTLTGGSLVTGTQIDLGASGNVFANDGILDIGGTGSVLTAALTGTLTQSATGLLKTDVRFDNAQASDLLKVSGDTTLNGRIKPNNLYLMPGVSVKILQATGALADGGVKAVNSPTISYGLDFNNLGGAGALDLTVAKVNFGAPSGLTGNQGSLAQYFQNIWDAGGAPPLASAMGYLVSLDSAAYADALDHLNSAPYLDQVGTSLTTGLNFTNNLMSCHGFDGSHAAIREHECNWVKITGGVANQTRTAAASGYRDNATRIQAGRQIKLAPDWFLGVAAGYERGRTTTDIGAATNADRFDGGMVLKHELGPWIFAGALDAGYAALDTDRTIGFPTPGLTANSRSSVWHVDGRLRAGYLMEEGAWYLKPLADIDLMYVNMPSFNESGAGALDLQVAGISDTRFAATPSLEIGATVPGDSSYVYRPFVSFGATWYSKNTWQVSAELEGAPPGVDPFVTTTEMPRMLGNLSAGLDIFSAKETGGLDLRLQYDAQVAHHYLSQTGAMKFAIRF
jgi:hypothetical protein